MMILANLDSIMNGFNFFAELLGLLMEMFMAIVAAIFISCGIIAAVCGAAVALTVVGVAAAANHASLQKAKKIHLLTEK